MRTLILTLSLLLALPVQAAMTQRTATKVERAWALYEEQKVAEGIEILAGINAKDPESKAYIARLLGSFYWGDNQPEQALKQLHIALDSGGLDQPNEAQTRRMVADIYLSDGQHQQALPHYQWLLTKATENGELNIDQANVHLRLAQCHIGLSQWPLAAKHGKASAQAEPKKDAYRLWLAAELQQKHWPQAEQPASALVELEPAEGINWRRLATVQLQQQKQKDALTTLALAERNGVLEQDTELLLLAQLYASQGMPELAAREVADRLGSVIKDDLDNRQTVARYWQAAREWDSASAAWAHAAKLKPALALNQLTILVQQRQLKQTNKVIAKLDNAQLSGDDAKQYQLLAVQAFYLQGDYAKALAHADKLAILDADVGNSWRKYLQARLM